MDLDGDGKRDLAVGNINSGNVSILRGRGDGSFVAAVNYDAGTNPYTVSIGFLNGGGTLDLAVANPQAGTASILTGNGDGTFSPKVTCAVGGAPVALAIGDFNGDGKAELALANGSSNTVSILLNISHGLDDHLCRRSADRQHAGEGPSCDRVAQRHQHAARTATTGGVLFHRIRRWPLGRWIHGGATSPNSAGALDAVYDVLGLTRPTYVDATITPGVTTAKRIHITQLRDAMARRRGIHADDEPNRNRQRDADQQSGRD